MVLGDEAFAATVPRVVAQIGHSIAPSMQAQDAFDTKPHLVGQLAFSKSLHLLAVE